MEIGYRRILLAATVAAAVAGITSGAVSQDAGTVQSLRGETEPLATEANQELYQPVVGNRFVKNYRQQPPLIPHKIEKYEIDLKVNQCLRCHDWPQNVPENAPKISETHYWDREGKALDQISGSRWFCVQCHVPQTDAPELVENTFRPTRRAR